MTRIKLRYDGWLALAAALRRQLSIDTGDTLEAEVVDGAIVLRLLDSRLTTITAPEPPAPAVITGKRGRPTKAGREPAAPRLRVGGRRTAKPTAG
jgi:hypothetical protein